MTQVLSPSDEEIKDFTEHVHVKFRIDADVFVGVSNIPALHLMEFAATFDGITESAMMQDPEAFGRIFHLVLVSDSADRFFERMGSRDEPISMVQVMNVMPWIMEQYGMRPTEPSGTSSNGSENPGGGTNSTVNGQLVAPIPAYSPPAVS
jgi:hypothetical protein